ncbi:MAG: TolC family protein [Candidatus Kapaibacterium sp.]|nr:TolC family protein [Ignavibacteriota bacterium]MCB9220402.1 TolC family protein [Ignavibacteria bacterium]
MKKNKFEGLMMNNRKSLIALITMLFITTIGTNAQEKISLDEAIKLALENNNQLKSALYDVNKAEADVDEAYGHALPSVDLSANYTRYLEPMRFFISGGLFPNPDGSTGGPGRFIDASSDNAIDARIDVSQTLFNSAVFRSISGADNYYDAAKLNLNVKVDELVFNVKSAYLQALLQKESYELVKASKSNAETSFKDIKVLYEEGLIGEYDMIRAEVQVENFAPQLISAENEYENAKNNLKVIMGMEPQVKIELTDELNSFKDDYSDEYQLNEIEDKILLVNPQLSALTMQEEVNKDFIAVYESEYLPTLSAFGNYSLQGQSNDFNFPTATTSTVGLRFKMNLFSGLQTSARVEKAELDLKKTKTQVELVELSLKSQIKNLVKRIESSKKQLEANIRNISQAQRGYDISKIRYDEGIGSLLEINDSDLALRTAKINNLRTKFELLISFAQLDQLLGNYSNKYRIDNK